MMKTFEEIFKNRSVFVTGHTGFMGSWLTEWLCDLGAKVIGFSLQPPTNPSLFEIINLEKRINHIIGDINDHSSLQKSLQEHSPEFIFHLAAQPLVKESYASPLETIQTNILGTTHLLESIKKTPSVKVCVIVTTDKCYENRELDYAYKEIDPLGGYDPYSASKGAAELITSSYRNSFFNPRDFSEHGISLSTARIGNVIGGGDWAKNRLIPDIARSLSTNQTVHIRNPTAIRPWQHVLESISGLLCLSKKMYEEPTLFAEPWNLGPLTNSENFTVSQLTSQIISEWGSGDFNTEQDNEHHEANLLMLDSSKAIEKLGWHPVYSIKDAISMTISWYKEYFSANDNMHEFTKTQISKYVEKAKQMNLRWTTNI